MVFRRIQRSTLFVEMILIVAFLKQSLSFVSVIPPKMRNSYYGRSEELRVLHNDGDHVECQENGRRRKFVQVSSLAGMMLLGNGAQAADVLFKANPLTNSALEQLRIWEQVEADNIKYGGELEEGGAGNKGKVNAYPKLLIPILRIDQELSEVKTLVRAEDPRQKAWSKALVILQNEKYEKVNFKKIFNAYGDNIYYSDPDRANLYLGGGASPKTEQSLAYLLRNDILTNVEDLRAELEYLLRSGESDVEDLYSFADIAVRAMQKYLAIVPPNELEEAKKNLV